MNKYALTEKEREWLANRTPVCCELIPPKSFDGKPQSRCPDCKYNLPHGQCSIYHSDYRDAAEFEARVAAKLAEHAGSGGRRGGIGTLLRPHGCSWYNADGYRETVCPPGHDIDKCTGIPFCNLYLARIAVEQEMDDELE